MMIYSQDIVSAMENHHFSELLKQWQRFSSKLSKLMTANAPQKCAKDTGTCFRLPSLRASAAASTIQNTWRSWHKYLQESSRTFDGYGPWHPWHPLRSQ